MGALEDRLDSAIALRERAEWGETVPAMRDALRHCLTQTIELGRAASLLRAHELTTCQALIARALHERMVRSAWVSLSVGNAESFLKQGRGEFLRQAKKQLGLGHLKASHRVTRADRSVEMAAAITKLGVTAPVPFDSLASEAGISRAHNKVYGFLSAIAHGHFFATGDTRQLHHASLAASAGYIEAVMCIVLNRLQRNRPTSEEELLGILEAGPA